LKRVADHIIATLGEWGRKASIHLTGGEPLLKTELFPLLKDLDRRDEVQELGIITNGLSLDGEVADRLSAFAKLKKIKVSLDGGDAETNDSIRTQGTFEKVLQNLPFLGERKRFEVFLMFTVMRRNFRSILPFIHLGQELGVDGLIFERFIPWGRGRGILGEVLDKDLWRRLVGTLFQFFSLELREGEAFPYQAFQVQFRGDDSELLGAPCVLGKDGICVMPDGTVFPCRRFPLPIGNLLDTSLGRVWEESEVLQTLRERENLKGKCGRCDQEECTGCRSLAFALTGDYLAEDPNCWYHPPAQTSPSGEERRG